ncbi:delta-lactam-biosynthetic de-N-acetylase [Anaerobacillus sp. MEB173]|uniref:delta-lactam-biosynthetic de-N-acetylase n=1 Tax=Anaerobacillus sp. MEB173 TaxID=3383345 RepID=UPI003F8F839A
MKKHLFLIFLLLTTVIAPLSSSVTATENYSNKAYDWSFKPNKTNEPVTTEPLYDELLTKYGGYFIGDSTKKELYLTFDNGYENGYTAQILDVLKEKQVPAAFFVTGHYLKTEEALIKRMVDEGHIVGNHSWHHPSLAEVSDERLKDELEKVRDKFTEMTGIKEMNYLRPPRGIFSERTLALSNELGYTNVFWSMAYKDWEVEKQKGWKHAYDQIMKRVHPGSIMLLHSVSKDNAEALGKVIDDLKVEGYTFKSLDDLMMSKHLPN